MEPTRGDSRHWQEVDKTLADRAGTVVLQPEPAIPICNDLKNASTSCYGLPLTCGGARRCTPVLQTAASRCWDSLPRRPVLCQLSGTGEYDNEKHDKSKTF